jgi:2'-deoxynucleoside 5'-phosphate N-hydrolase
MIAYFTASVVGKKYHLANYLKIIDILKSNKMDVISDHIINVDEQNISLQSKEKRLAFHTQLEKWINNCDIMVVESTFPSISVGYEISLAIHRNKPVLILYSEGDPPSLFAYHEDEKLICEKYSDDTLKPIIEDFLNYASVGTDHRFTFFINAEITSYLEKVSRTQKLPKSVYLRKLIETDMKK